MYYLKTISSVNWCIFYTDLVVEFDPVTYGPILEGQGQSITFRIVARSAVTSEITVLFSTVDGTAIGIYIGILVITCTKTWPGLS